MTDNDLSQFSDENFNKLLGEKLSGAIQEALEKNSKMTHHKRTQLIKIQKRLVEKNNVMKRSKR